MREIVVNDKVLRLVGDGLVNFKDCLNQSRKQAIALESPHPVKVQQAAGNVAGQLIYYNDLWSTRIGHGSPKFKYKVKFDFLNLIKQI